MRLDDSNKISFDYMFTYTLAEIYKISLNDELCQVNNLNVASVSKWRKYIQEHTKKYIFKR